MSELQIPLIPEEPFEIPEDLPLLCQLLEQATTLAAVGNFLASKGEPHSVGSWPDLQEKRLIPALKKRKISMVDLKLLLAEVEEFGHTHTILFHCPPSLAKKFLDSTELAETAKGLGLSKSLGPGIHMLLPELRNEFAIPASCSKSDYEYVLDQLTALSN
jgi:hypothetical protein